MAAVIDGYVAQLAQIASNSTGLNKDVILAHWNAEEGVSSANWPGNNPAGITPGNSAVDALGTGALTSGGFVVFPTPAAGAQGYATLINTDPNYAGIRASIKTGNAVSELQAIVASPWDAAHYSGGRLFNSYTAITGMSIGSFADVPGATQTYGPNSTQPTNQISYPPTNYSIVANSQRFGNVQYGRRYRVLVSNSSGVALDVSDLRCQFNVQTVINQQPPFSTVTIYNLNPTTENLIINFGDKITVEAGYEGMQYGLIFEGDVVESIRDKSDNVTFRLVIYALASNRQLNQAFASFTLAKGQSARSVVENLASQATIPTPIGEISPQLSKVKLPRGKVVFGLTRDYLRQIAQANNVAFYSPDGSINLLHASDPPKGEIIDLTPQSGLIGEPAQQDLGVTFDCLLNPAITINTMVHIDSTIIQAQAFQIGQVQRPLDAQGIYRVVGVTHVGDTRDNDWKTSCVTVSQAGGIPGMISTSTASPWG